MPRYHDMNPRKFFTPALTDGLFLLRLRDSKSPQISKIDLSILADFCSAVVKKVQIHQNF